MLPVHKMQSIYRKGSFGRTLIDELDELILADKITPQLTTKILGAFDRAMSERLGRQARATMSSAGKLRRYRYLEGVFYCQLRDVVFGMVGDEREELEVFAHKLRLTTRESPSTGGISTRAKQTKK